MTPKHVNIVVPESPDRKNIEFGLHWILGVIDAKFIGDENQGIQEEARRIIKLTLENYRNSRCSISAIPNTGTVQAVRSSYEP